MTSLPAAKRMRLSKAGELRALTRLLGESDHAPESQREIWRKINALGGIVELQDVELNEAPLVTITNPVLNESSDSVTLDAEAARAIYASAWAGLERALIESNAAYNASPDDEEAHYSRARTLYDSFESAMRYASVVLALTPIPLDDEDED